ncbi:ABC transporter substrate-binding protein [Magnetospirillum sp. 15-1]|uniref:ABC transporter substrate-binding protein n=1 Tax=Magnetospirillum sp. 15-1 TaxID=1979370 RepID=UPI000BBB6E44|nr:ABC transporter substrate-binding protein [Magnetospirillum sp. 15-1]
MRNPYRLPALALLLIVTVFPILPAMAERVVVDMAGRSVTVPDTVRRVATIGPVPVLNSLVFAVGGQGTIANGLPPNLGGARWKYQYLLAPGLEARPVIQGSEGGPSLEGIIALAPEVVLTMDRRTVEAAERVGLATLYLSWRQPEEVKAVIGLLARLYGVPEAGRTYDAVFDAMMARVVKRLAGRPEAERPRVLYASLKRLTQPHLIAEWWIAQAGGRSVTDDGRTAESLTFSLEQLLAWNPEVLIVSSPAEVAEAYADPRFSGLAAIRHRRVHAVPMGAHLWGNRTAEQPLTVLWAATVIRPDLFGDIHMTDEVAAFYRDVFGFSLSPEMAAEILAGRPGQ